MSESQTDIKTDISIEFSANYVFEDRLSNGTQFVIAPAWD